jgi:Outer membrane protein beta-barrel domain
MKLLSVVCTALLISTTVTSQTDLAIFVGPQATSAKYVVAEKDQKTSMKYGFQAGASMKVPFENKLYFAPAAFYSMKGYKVAFTEFAAPPDVTAIDNSTTIHSFELAALLQYDFGNSPSHFFIKGGPTLDFQLFGKEKFATNTGGTVSRNMKWGPADYGRYGANLLAQFGYETNSGFLIFAQYTFGATSINNKDFGPSIRHRAFGISIGKYLKKQKIVMNTKNKE